MIISVAKILAFILNGRSPATLFKIILLPFENILVSNN